MKVHNKMKWILERAYSDLVVASRLESLGQLIENAKQSGYRTISVSGFWKVTLGGSLRPLDKFLILRHDVDTSLRTLREMWKIEKAAKVFGFSIFASPLWM